MMNHKLSFTQAKQIAIVDYLAGLGFDAAKVRGDDHWYHSPFRDERTPSFKVNRKRNVWYDHGTGEGGTILDLGAKLNQCTLSEFLEKLSAENYDFSFHRQPNTHKPENRLEVLAVNEISSPDLLYYLRTRGISKNLVRTYCKEVDFRIGERGYKAIGFPNQSNAYELRNSWFKGSSSPKDISLINNNSCSISVLEGFIDFLSLMQLDHKETRDLIHGNDFLILNSLSLLGRSIPLLQSYKTVNIFLDNDLAAKEAKHHLSGIHFYDASLLYNDFKDLNEYLIAMQKLKEDQIPQMKSKRMRR
ncbi:toprim domain-containing protein [Ohtaekwangia koreensis]|nr:toprim domain-containing protein [Ohtaekwangia koreensis]